MSGRYSLMYAGSDVLCSPALSRESANHSTVLLYTSTGVYLLPTISAMASASLSFSAAPSVVRPYLPSPGSCCGSPKTRSRQLVNDWLYSLLLGKQNSVHRVIVSGGGSSLPRS